MDTKELVMETVMPASTVQVHALSAGYFTLPEEQFVSPVQPTARKRVPSLCFLVQHTCSTTGDITRIMFDLGLRRDIDLYSKPIRSHVDTRQPLTTDPDVVKSLKAGGLAPTDIDYVIYSHVHWDHVGEPRDFLHSTFVVGYGSIDLLNGKSVSLRGGHSFFESDLLDPLRTIELPDPSIRGVNGTRADGPPTPPPLNPNSINLSGPWKTLGDFPSVLDLFQDGSTYLVDSPGHLPGHINLLARIGDGAGTNEWVYLAGDACHDRRIIRKEKCISEWQDAHGQICCIHADRAQAEDTIQRIRNLEDKGVEVILAHDVEWASDQKNQSRFFGGSR